MGISMKKIILCVAAAAALTIGTGVASAATLYQANPSSVFGGNGSATVKIYYGNDDKNVRAGGFALTTNLANPASSFVAWCLDIFHVLSLPEQYTVTTTPFSTTTGLIDTTRLANIQKLFNTGYSDVVLTDNNKSAGFQLALWELLYETSGTFSLNSGFFEANNTAARTFANTLLSQLNDVVTDAFEMIFYESAENSKGKQLSQNLVSVTPVPLPAAGLMLGAGLLGLVALKRLKRRDAAAAP